MNIFLYVIIFVTGAFFGSFFTLAVYRIPRKEDILIKRSYCPNCNHKLGFFDLFPIFSYFFLKGKCRYCGNKIRPRYLIIEILSGFTFLLIYLSLKITIFNFTNFIELVMILLYISILFIIAGIDKENFKIQKSVVFFGYIVETIYIIYQYTLGNYSVYQYVIYLLTLIVLLALSIISLKMYMEEKYYIQILYLSLYMIVFYGSKVYIITVLLTLITIAIYKILSKTKTDKLSIGFYLCTSNIITIILSNIILNYLI